MNELDEITAWLGTHGLPPMPLDGWDHASHPYAQLRRNTANPAKPLGIRIEPDQHTSAIISSSESRPIYRYGRQLLTMGRVTALHEVENQSIGTLPWT